MKNQSPSMNFTSSPLAGNPGERKAWVRPALLELAIAPETRNGCSGGEDTATLVTNCVS